MFYEFLLILLILLNLYMIYFLINLNFEIKKMNIPENITENDIIPEITPDEFGKYPDFPENKVVKISNLLDYQFNSENQFDFS